MDRRDRRAGCPRRIRRARAAEPGGNHDTVPAAAAAHDHDDDHRAGRNDDHDRRHHDHDVGRHDHHAGDDRYATAAAVSEASFAAGVPVAYVATGSGFADALAAGPVAAADGGPILLVDRDTIPAATGAELDRLRPQRIVVLGGTAVV